MVSGSYLIMQPSAPISNEMGAFFKICNPCEKKHHLHFIHPLFTTVSCEDTSPGQLPLLSVDNIRVTKKI